MNDDKPNKNPGHSEHSAGTEGSSPSNDRSKTASRARNQTVILTPELTGQVRALLGKDEQGAPGQVRGADPLSDLLPPMSWEQGADSDAGSGSHTSSTNGTDYGADIKAEAIETKNPTGKLARPGANVRATTVANRATPAFSVNRGSSGSHAGGAISTKPKTKIVGFMISFDTQESGEVFEIRRGRWLLTSKTSDHGDCILINDETISPLHAIIRATEEGTIQVLDQLSEFGTSVIRMPEEKEEEVTGAMVNLSHGDLVRFGKRHFVVCLVPKAAKSKQTSEG